MDHLLSQGRVIKSIYYVDKGLLRGYYNKEGEEYTMGFHFAPFIITDIPSLRDKVPCTMNLQALKDSECYECDFAELEDLIKKYPNLLNVFFKLCETLLVNSKKRRQSLIFDTPKERYLNLFRERHNVIAEIPQHYN